MFRKSIVLKLLVVLISISMFLSGCGSSGGTDKEKSNWEYEKQINEPIKGMSGEEDLVLGNLDENKVEVFIPAGAFLEPTEVTLINPDTIASYKEDEMEGLGAPIAIVAGEGAVRLEQAVKITMKYDPAELEENYESGELYIGYFNGSEWQYMRTEVDRENNLMWFYTSHFSPYGGAKLKFDKRIDEYITNEAVAEWAKEQTSTITDEALKDAINNILKEKLKLNDDSLTGKILLGLNNDDEWLDMVSNIKDGDPEKFNQNLQVLMGKKIVEMVPTSKLKSALDSITGDLGIATVEKASEAAGYLAEGRTKDAAKIIGEHIADQFMITKVGKFAVAAIDSQIKSWKSKEIEAAYLAYKNGAQSSIPWWGYQVEKGNFDDVWSQMGGAARQLEIDAIKDQNKAREEAFMPLLTLEEENKIRGSVQRDLKRQFESRLQKDTEIEKKKVELEMIMGMFKDANLLEKGRFGWTNSYELETRLDILNNFKNKLLRDTGKNFIKTGNLHNEDAIAIEQLKSIAMHWFATEDLEERKKIYEQFLKSEFDIDLYPSATEISGPWSSSSITITSFNLGEAPPESSAGEGEGCDLTDYSIYIAVLEGLEDMKGKNIPIQISINIGDSGNGTMEVTSEDGAEVINATYNSGHINAVSSEEGTTVTYSGDIQKNSDGSIILSGSIFMKLSEEAWIKGNWIGTK